MILIVLKTVHQKGNTNGQFSPTVGCVNPISKTISLPIQDHPADPLSMLKQNEAMIFIQFTHRCHPKYIVYSISSIHIKSSVQPFSFARPQLRLHVLLRALLGAPSSDFLRAPGTSQPSEEVLFQGVRMAWSKNWPFRSKKNQHLTSKKNIKHG